MQLDPKRLKRAQSAYWKAFDERSGRFGEDGPDAVEAAIKAYIGRSELVKKKEPTICPAICSNYQNFAFCVLPAGHKGDHQYNV